MEQIKWDKVFIEIEYKDESSFTFDVLSHAETKSSFFAEIMMITRGTLMASNAYKATAYDKNGFPIAACCK